MLKWDFIFCLFVIFCSGFKLVDGTFSCFNLKVRLNLKLFTKKKKNCQKVVVIHLIFIGFSHYLIRQTHEKSEHYFLADSLFHRATRTRFLKRCNLSKSFREMFWWSCIFSLFFPRPCLINSVSGCMQGAITIMTDKGNIHIETK